MTNPQLLDFQQARTGFSDLAKARRQAREEYQKHSAERAQAEHDYRVRMAQRMLHYRTEGKGVGESEILAKGDVAPIVLKRDIAESLAKAALLRVEELEADRSGLRQLAEWTQRVDPTGTNE